MQPKRNFLIDIDGTITEDVPNEEPEKMAIVQPFQDAIETINKWYDDGHTIYFFTARTQDHKEITEDWLNRCGFKYHGVLYCKPRGGNYIWIDNLNVIACQYQGDFTKLKYQIEPEFEQMKKVLFENFKSD